jgi:hypothetical protein
VDTNGLVCVVGLVDTNGLVCVVGLLTCRKEVSFALVGVYCCFWWFTTRSG